MGNTNVYAANAEAGFVEVKASRLTWTFKRFVVGMMAVNNRIVETKFRGLWWAIGQSECHNAIAQVW